MIPCHIASHWVLLVGNLKGRYWDFYDSLPNPMHMTSLRENVHCYILQYNCKIFIFHV
ncbi:hypothetical protein KSP40_PGU016017 [Platanthera guangdongensis]|uniref:Ubiquitin-like protease family profile domain-containing protein n=1 Tax=Platanthera guangdongensis TaxID=2320717 RepID=A0ABR2M4S0_9ASPA